MLTLRVMRNILVYFVVVLTLCSCNAVSSLVGDDGVVARVGKDKLYLSELEAYIPNLISSEDSAKMAESYIRSWATDLLYLKMAGKQLSEEEMDVSAELENYRRSLLKYRYEQRYINDRLDTLVTEEQVQEYYNGHKADFELQRPILKVRFVDVMKDAPGKDSIIRLMKSDKAEDAEKADTLARTAALRYFDRSDHWMDAAELAREFGTDYSHMLSLLEDGFIKLEKDGRGDLMAAYVREIIYSGTAPLEFCSESIREIILSGRKHSLVTSLEQDLLEDARERKLFVTY